MNRDPEEMIAIAMVKDVGPRGPFAITTEEDRDKLATAAANCVKGLLDLVLDQNDALFRVKLSSGLVGQMVEVQMLTVSDLSPKGLEAKERALAAARETPEGPG